MNLIRKNINMTNTSRRNLSTFIRMIAFVAYFVVPVGTFAYVNAGTAAEANTGAGFVLYVSLQRNAG